MPNINNISTAKYTDKDMQILSQLAYVDFSDDMLKLTFSEILNDPESSIKFTNYFLGENQNPAPGSAAEADYNWKLGVLELLKNDEKYSNWKLVETSSNVDGFYAIMVETDPDNAVVAFRGTQMTEEPIQDLVLADLLLLNNAETLQQKSARTYITNINEQYSYSNYVVAGHSLGGNLATHAFLTAPDDMNIVNAYSLDGPGFSDEYLTAAESILQEKGDRIYHYQWSIVGHLLNQPDYENRSYISATWSSLNPVEKHSLCFMGLNENDSVIPCASNEFKFLEDLAGVFSAGVDNADEVIKIKLMMEHTPIGVLLTCANMVWNYSTTVEEFGVDAANKQLASDTGGFIFGAAAMELAPALVAALQCGPVAATVISVAFVLFATDLGKEIGGFVYDVACEIMDGVKGVISSWVDNPYYLQKMANEGSHNIDDHFGVNLLVFPNGITAEDVRVTPLGENDAVELRWGDDEDDYVVIQNFNNSDNNTRYNFLFSSFVENELPKFVGIYANDPNSPFRNIHGTSDNDVLAPVFNDQYTTALYGYEGDDMIFGGAADDIINGGAGNDTIFGGNGADTYIVGKNNDYDIIFDNDGNNVIKFTDGITEDDLMTVFSGDENIIIKIKNGGNVELVKFRVGEQFQNYTMEFESGNGAIDSTNDSSPIRRVHGTDEDDDLSPIIEGRVSLWGHEGNDRLNGSDEADKLYGGSGNDILYGGDGNDTYCFNAGDGEDVIDDTVGITTIDFSNLSKDDIIAGLYETQGEVLYSKKGGNVIKVKRLRNTAPENLRLKFQNSKEMAANDPDSPLMHLHGTDGIDDITALYENGEVYGLGGNDSLTGTNGDDTLFGGDGNDRLYGEEGNDTLIGGSGGDCLYGRKGDDTIDGGLGDDRLDGEAGDDTYVFGKGYGYDFIVDNIGENKVKFSEDFSLKNTYVTIDGNNVIFKVNENEEDKLNFYNFRNYESYRQFSLAFSDETISADADNSPFRRIHGDIKDNTIDAIYSTGDTTIWGHEGSDHLRGAEGDDTLYGGDGGDYLYGNDGNDYLDGGSGNDSLYGDDGDDTYIFGSGYGSDTIFDNVGENTVIFSDNFKIEDTYVMIDRDYTILKTDENKEDELMFFKFENYESYRQFSLAFSDETISADADNSPFRRIHGDIKDNTIDAIYSTGDTTIWGHEGSDHLRGAEGDDTLYGGDGGDYLYGNDGNDYLDGGSGNDSLYGDDGDDTYIFGSGYGNDTISDSSGTNIIKLADVATDDISVEFPTDNYHAVLTIASTGETLTIQNFRSSAAWRNFILEFDDGTTGTIDINTSSLILDIAEEDIVEANAELLTELYEDDSLESELFSEADGTVISEVTDSVSVADETDTVADQTDVQAMILAENMSAFADESSVSDNVTLTDTNMNMLSTDQLLAS